MSSRTLICLLFLLIAIAVGSASPQAPGKQKISPTLSLIDAGAWKSVQKASSRENHLERTEPDTRSISNSCASIPMDHGAPSACAQYQLKAASAMTFVEHSGAVAAINANY
jgi:hypothetical protein